MSATTGRQHSEHCAQARNPKCVCPCANSGHQTTILFKCVNHPDPEHSYTEIVEELNQIFGEHQVDFDRPQTSLRAGRSSTIFPIPMTTKIMGAGKGATRFESLVLDEAVHDVLRRTADDPSTKRLATFVKAITEDCVDKITDAVIAAKGLGTGVADAHIWCSLAASSLDAHRRATGGRRALKPGDHSRIAYPRQTKPTTPRLLEGSAPVAVLGTGLLSTAIASCGLSNSEIDRALSLVAMTCCPDIWHHPAVARLSVDGTVASAKFVRIPNFAAEFAEVARRWHARKNW
jgi:hypothetical protein